DDKLQELNSDYEAKRFKNMAMQMPKIQRAPNGTFHHWLKAKGKLGGQHKVPRLCNDRSIIDEVLESMEVVS
ncbi:MAG: GH3 auxin-responsive promoter family protein, partial [Bacteroidota bacterium]|nr:GH3 auxin-responsive promoter family protein [Bacteroidota bacterium]